MKHIVFNINDKKGLKNSVKEAKKDFYKSKLIQVFTAITDKKQIKKLIDKLDKKFPDSIIIGTTTAGEIAHAKMYENTTIISVSLFKTTTLKANYIDKIDKKSGIKLSKKICSKNTKATILLSDGLNGKDYEGFIKGIKREYPDIIISGGLAGDNFQLENTLIFLNKNVYNKGTVAVTFSGKNLFADNKYNLNWTPIGKKFTITKSNGNIVHKIDNQDAVSLFKKYLGDDIFLNNAKALPDFQLLYKEGSTIVSRTPLAKDKESLIFAGPLKVGQEVQFGFSNAVSVISGSHSISKQIKKNPAEAIYIFSCIARKTLLGKKLEDEFNNFESIAPTAGFFTYGEYYSTSANNALLNCTTTLLVLSESTKKSKQNQQKQDEKNLDDITFNALTHFIQQTSDELNSNIKLLNQYKDAVDSTLLVSKTNKRGIITFVNDNFCQVSKYSREELLGKKHNIVRDTHTSKFIFKKMWNTIQNGKTWRGEFPNRAKDGSIYYVNATIMPTYNDDKKIDGYIALRQDITKQIISKNKMKEKEKFIKAIFDNQDNIVILSSKSQGIINANKTLYQYFDYKNLETFRANHHCICDLFLEEKGYLHSITNDDWLDEIAKNDHIDYKAKILIKDNTVHTFNIKVKKIDNEYIINLSDITNLEMALHKAYSSEQAKSIFLANMSHEIRTPLNGILGFTDVLTRQNLDKDSKRYVDIIHKSGQSLLNVVNDILDFSKLESGELTLYEIESNLFAEMEATVSIFASTAKTKHIDYYTYIDTNMPKKLKCDSQRIKQVLNNLVSNAIKFTPENGKVKVTISTKKIKDKKATILFSVKDSGIGIKKEKLPTIFQAFSQADNSISRKFGGTGLGLSISHQYTQIMGGNIKVDSKEGEGSEFYFELTLPIIDASASMQKTQDTKMQNISILQPEDAVVCGINQIVETYLRTWNCNFDTINSIDKLDEKTDILIVCAKNFEEKSCYDALERYSKLQLIYVEGGEDKFSCTHPKFHLVEQPMTGSALFDKIITLTHIESTLETKQTNEVDIKYKGNILIAEDNETNQMLISIMLDERGIKYKIVENGKEAVENALMDHYDLIFMDINMPVMDGVTATKILREKNYNDPIVSLSANVIESDIKTFLEAGIDDTLNKPIVTSELDSILDRYLSKNILFDIIDVNRLKTELSLPSDEIIIKLLNSFADSAKELIEVIKTNNLDENTIHSIKGLTGNLRFHTLYSIIKTFEAEFQNWDEDKKIKNSTLTILHLQEAIKNIEKLNSFN